MSLASPIFSIVIPTYNRAHLIARTIESVLKQQSCDDFEVLIIDDGSKDNTGEVVRNFKDYRMRYYFKENAERGAARNFGAIRAVGQYINFFDSDDVMYPNHLAIANNLIQRLNKPEFFHLAYDYKLEDGTLVGKMDSFDESTRDAVFFDNTLSCNGIFIRRDIARQFPFEEDRVLSSSEDWELWIRLISRFKLHLSNEITSTVISHDQRSLLTIDAKKVVDRDLLFIDTLRRDAVVMLNYGYSFRRFIAERYTFFMLCFAEQRQRREVWKWGWKAFWVYPLILLSKRFLASIKNTLK